ncbi:inositol monophosphatase family protein [Mycobacterium sp. ITM-2016-00317]|uniref:inositol monophosphatase family protein n=1 Tax=Mycobacterium sp. ITM-2016-00317 TaxID=2099694 RepID=UPI00287FE549|nr:inositol monophosphatase family protein [Mycobacterium sp. ITM-2016-00317]WNG85959.1 inositol monophosphatase family protein [Mycobacterium sp. ITM-2016-00317]
MLKRKHDVLLVGCTPWCRTTTLTGPVRRCIFSHAAHRPPRVDRYMELTPAFTNQKWSTPTLLFMSTGRAERIGLSMRLADVAGRISREHFEKRNLQVQTKADGTPVTDADRGIERLLRDAVGAEFADDGFTGEEYPETHGSSGFRWIVDPIDGTKSFVRGIPLYANLIALQEDGEIVFGLINLPSAQTTVHAELGKGCWSNGVQVRVSDRNDLDGAYVMATWLEDWDLQVIDDLHACGAVLRTWGDAFGYAMVACGRVDAVVDYTAQPFDLAPMSVIIEEAGGRFTSLDGRRTFDALNGMASNGLIHDELLEHVSPKTASTTDAQ